MPTPLFLHKISSLIVTSFSQSSLLGLSVLELAAICVNLTLVLLFLFVVSVKKILVNNRNRIGKNHNTTGTDTLVIDTETTQTSHVSNISVWFKLSVLSCFYVLFVQVLVLGFDLCVSIWAEVLHWPVLFVSASQVLAWFVLSFSALNSKFKGLEKFPFLLRVWWILSFLICFCGLYVDGRGFWVEGSKYFSSRVVANFAVTPGLAFLGVVAVRGVTGIQVCKNSDLQEPLLVVQEEEELGCLKVTPYWDAGLFSLATLFWLNPLLSLGAKRPLELKDIPLVAPSERAKTSYKVVNSNWEKLKAENQNQNLSKQPSLAWALLKSFWKEAALNAVFAGMTTLVSYVGPYMISYFVDFLGGIETFAHEGYILAGIFFMAKLVETLTTRQWYLGVDILGMHVRSALTAMVYRKGLRLSSSAKQSHTSGEIVNYMAVDVQRVGDFAWYLHDMWMLPLQIALALAILYKNVGIAFVATLIATIISIVVTIPVARIQEEYQDKLMSAKDERMRKTSECLRNMRILKLQAWEDRYRIRLEEMRGVEYKWLRKALYSQAFITFIFWSSPIFVSAVTFATTIFLGTQLTAGGVLSALATFRILQEPLRNFPDLVSTMAQTKVSLDRISNFLQDEELREDATTVLTPGTSNIAIEIMDGVFCWDTSSSRPTLSGIHVKVERGMSVAVCGTVGSGKSSFLSCILGEIPKLSGEVRLCGSAAYVSQSAWIQSGNIEENILFGNPMDKAKYKNVIHACSLKKDLELFSHGDQTIIGERGINMSGGQKQRIHENGVDVIRENGDEVSKEMERKEPEPEPKSRICNENGFKPDGRNSSLRNGERTQMEGFRRKLRGEMENVRFATSSYPDEGPSNGYPGFSNSYKESWRDYKGKDGADRVQHLEHDRAELLWKLDELKHQLSKSSEVVNNQKEKALLDERMIPPDPHHQFGGSDPWFPDGSSGLNRTSGKFFGPDKHVAGPPHRDYHHDPYPYIGGHETAMPNFHPSMHNPNPYGDPFASQMLRRGPHQFSQQPLHPYFPGRYVEPNPDSYELYAQNSNNAMLHPLSCSCFHCYDNKRRGSVPGPPASFVNSRFPDAPNERMLYHHHEIPGTFGSHAHNSRALIPAARFGENQLHTRWPSDFNAEMVGGVRNRSRKVMLASSSRRCRPVAGGSPFITCHNCFELLQLPKKALVLVRNHQQKVRCGACSSEISISVINKKLVISPHSEMNGAPSKIDDRYNEVLNSRVSHARAFANRSRANFSSDDYSGYDFLSVDRETLSAVALNSNKSQEMPSFHSSSLSTSEDENSSESMTASREAVKSVLRPTTDSLSPPSGSPPQEYIDHSNSNRTINRFGKGNRSSRSEQDKAKLEKITSRQNSLKETAVATEMDVLDYSNTGVSQDSRDASREHDHPRSNKGSESFLANIIKKSFRSNQTDDRGKINVTVNGKPLSDRVVKKAEKLAGPIQPGNYWYDIRAGFWGIIGGPCLGIIPPFIEEFNHPLPEKCSGGNTGVFVNGRELHQKDLDLLSGRGLPPDGDRCYIIEISGRVLDEDTGEELDCLGKLAPTVEKVKHGFGMKAPRAAQ